MNYACLFLIFYEIMILHLKVLRCLFPETRTKIILKYILLLYAKIHASADLMPNAFLASRLIGQYKENIR